MGLTNQIKRGFHKHRQATLEGDIWMSGGEVDV